MTKRTAIVSLACLVAAACGGKSSGTITNPGSAALGRTFTYGGSPDDKTLAASGSSTALNTQVSDLVSAQGSLSSSSAQTAGEFSATASALLGSYSTPSALALSRLPAALVAASGNARATSIVGQDVVDFDNPACVQQGADSVTFTDCNVSVRDAAGTFSITANGRFHATPTAADWLFTLDMTLSASSGQSVSMDAHYGAQGNITAATVGSVTTLNGTAGEELAADATANGQSDGLHVSEALVLTGVAYDRSLQCIDGGTLEARRLWSKRPSGASAAALPDRGAQVTWTGCGTGNVNFSTN